MDQSRILFDGHYLRMRERDGWEYAERTNPGGAVLIVALTPRRTVLFVEQFRIPIGAKSIEMPAGLVGDIDGDESIELAAQRELLEETGWAAERIEFLMRGPSSSGMSNEHIAFVRAHGLRKVSDGGGDPSEDIVVHEVPLDGVASWLHARMAEGYSIDPKLYAGLYFLERNPDGSPASWTPDPTP